MGKPNQFKAADFIEAIPGTGGIVSAIARKVGCTWHTAKKYIHAMPTVKAVYEDECESVLDLAEVKLIEAVKGGDLAAVKYMLSTKGKDRGYTERQEVREQISVDVHDYRDDLERRLSGLVERSRPPSIPGQPEPG